MSEFTGDKTVIDCGGSKITINKDGDISITPKSGGKIKLEGPIETEQIIEIENISSNDDIDISSDSSITIESDNQTIIKGILAKLQNTGDNGSVSANNNGVIIDGTTIDIYSDTLRINDVAYARARYPNWVPVETKVLSSASNTTFSNLDGDADVKYLFDWNLTFSGDAGYIYLVPNGTVTSGQGGYTHWQGWWGGAYLDSGEAAATAQMRLVRGHGTGVTSKTRGTAIFEAKTGEGWRTLYTDHSVYNYSGGTWWIFNKGRWMWADGSTAVSSLKLENTVGTVSGWIKLYKWKDGITEI